MEKSNTMYLIVAVVGLAAIVGIVSMTVMQTSNSRSYTPQVEGLVDVQAVDASSNRGGAAVSSGNVQTFTFWKTYVVPENDGCDTWNQNSLKSLVQSDVQAACQQKGGIYRKTAGAWCSDCFQWAGYPGPSPMCEGNYEDLGVVAYYECVMPEW